MKIDSQLSEIYLNELGNLIIAILKEYDFYLDQEAIFGDEILEVLVMKSRSCLILQIRSRDSSKLINVGFIRKDLST